MTQDEILRLVAAKEMTAREAGQLLDSLLRCTVSRKGAISVYGLQWMPVTLYAEQWENLLDGAPPEHFVLAFIREWEGKDYKGMSAEKPGGPKVPYTARISRRTPVPCPSPKSGDGPQYASQPTASSTACSPNLLPHAESKERCRWQLRPKSILRWLLAALFAVLPSRMMSPS
jgi:hypothetical protein